MASFFNKLRDDVREKIEEHSTLYDAKVSLTHKKCARAELPHLPGRVLTFAQEQNWEDWKSGMHRSRFL